MTTIGLATQRRQTNNIITATYPVEEKASNYQENIVLYVVFFYI